MAQRAVDIEASWQALLADEFEQPYMQTLSTFLREQKRLGKQIYPPGNEIFAAFNATPVDQVKVVILGQDPYHGPNQAHGLCFSVRPGIDVPPSLRNIIQEINSDLGLDIRTDNGLLSGWAEQGVLLLNSVLTVEHARAASHQGKGWERFTDAVVRALATSRDNLVFLLWGSYAQKKGAELDTERHCVLRAPHPSPLSAHRGFFGCKHFSKANQYLEAHGRTPIAWQQLTAEQGVEP
ncbi:MAG: uracil-DNA glycosylase [Pseudomonadales bacterium]